MSNKLVLLPLLLLGACPPDDGSPDAGAISLEIGSDDGSGYQAIAPGGTIDAFMGPQGGFHLFLALRATGIFPGDTSEGRVGCSTPGDNPCIDFIVADTSRTYDQYGGTRVPLLLRDGAYQTVPGIRVVLDIQSLDEIDGKTLQVSATLTDKDGITVTGTVDAAVHAVR